MSLEAIQEFLAVYLRDANLRERHRYDQQAVLKQFPALDEQDRALLADYNYESLEKAANHFKLERFNKRRGEFGQFLDHLAVFVPLEEFFDAFDRVYCKGLLIRPLEMDKFAAFGTRYVLAGLPEYLLDLLRFCYLYCKVAELPYEHVENALEDTPASGLQPFHRIKLRRPFLISHFRYDALELARSRASPELAWVTPRQTTLLFQKDWGRPKSTRILYADEVEFLYELVDSSKTVMELTADHPAREYPWIISCIGRLWSEGMVDVTVPPYFSKEEAMQ